MESFEYDAIEEVYTNAIPQSKPKPKRIRKTMPGTCSVCSRYFKDRRHIYAHMRIHTGERPFVCELCNRAFNQSSHLKRHIKSHMGVKPFHCEVCNRYFTSKQYFDEHSRTHTGERPYACQFCEKRFAVRQMYISHMRCHEKKNSFACHLCDSKFDTEWQLKGHMRIHDSDGFAVMCDICKKVYARQNRLDEHLKTKHDIVIAFECNVCHQRFSQKIQLKRHYRQHEGKKKKTSPKKEIGVTYENRPIRTIKQEKTDSADESDNETESLVLVKKEDENTSNQDKEVISQEHLEKILGNSSAKNRFLCGVCLKEFSDVTDMNRHLVTHVDDEKPFICEICKEGFWSNIKLETHIKNNHDLDELMLKCFVCEETFHDQVILKKHTLTHTTENYLDS